jgi:hypothetical protein
VLPLKGTVFACGRDVGGVSSVRSWVKGQHRLFFQFSKDKVLIRINFISENL